MIDSSSSVCFDMSILGIIYLFRKHSDVGAIKGKKEVEESLSGTMAGKVKDRAQIFLQSNQRPLHKK